MIFPWEVKRYFTKHRKMQTWDVAPTNQEFDGRGLASPYIHCFSEKISKILRLSLSLPLQLKWYFFSFIALEEQHSCRLFFNNHWTLTLLNGKH